MRLKRPHVATLDEVTITRNGDDAIIEYPDQRIGTTHFRLGPQVQQMTDGDILDGGPAGEPIIHVDDHELS